ncbi:MAG: hypothetical protein ACREP8_07295 [Candidatus Binatia bacterium]
MTYGTSFSVVEDRAAYLFPEDVLLPHQYFEHLFRKNFLEPEKKLMFAVLEDAISCFQKYAVAQDRRGKRLFREAEEWILEESGTEIFSFENICEAIGWDSNYLREGLFRWKERKLNSTSPVAKVYQFNPRAVKEKTAPASPDPDSLNLKSRMVR